MAAGGFRDARCDANDFNNPAERDVLCVERGSDVPRTHAEHL